MFVLSNFIRALAGVVDIVLSVFYWLILIRALISWVNPDPYNPIVRFLYNVTEPVLHRIRTKLPVNFGGIDLSPIIVFLAIIFLQKFVVGSLQGIARSLLYQ